MIGATLAALGLAALDGAQAENKNIAGDIRVSRALDAEKLRWTLEDTGEYSVLIEWTNDAGRTQVVWIPSDTFSWQGAEYRDVYSIAFKTAAGKPVDAALANRMLVENNDSLLGFWAKQDDVIMNIAHIRADATPSEMRAAIVFVGETADDLEKEVTGKDDW